MKPAAIVFDLYGTLLDISALRTQAEAAGVAEPALFVETWRQKQIEYAWCSTLMDEYRDFDTITAKALGFALAAHGTKLDVGAQRKLAESWFTLPPYADVAPALAALRPLGFPLVVLTNGTRTSSERALRAASLRDAIDDVLSVEAVRVYKPDPRVYKMVTERFACEPEAVLFVSSNGWDASGAAAFGYRVAWCNRAKRPSETLGFPPAFTLAALPEIVTALA
jgi:2-haloacid dehalogenase